MINVYYNSDLSSRRHHKYLYYIEDYRPMSVNLLYKTDYVMDILKLSKNTHRFIVGGMYGKNYSNIKKIYSCEKIEDLNNIIDIIPEEFI